MAMKQTLSRRVFNAVNTVLLFLLAVVTLYPVLYVVFASFSDPVEYAKHTGLLFSSKGFSLEAYKAVLEKPEILTGYKNTIFYVLAGTTVNMLCTISFGYVLSQRQLKWHHIMNMMVVFTMFFSGGLIPTYIIVKQLGLIDTRAAIILPTAINSFNMIIMRTAFDNIPKSLQEAAEIDGAKPLRILCRVMFPLTLPTIAVVVLYYAVAQWNQWFQAMIYLRDQDLYPLQLFLRQILIDNNQEDMLVSTGSADQLALGEVIKHSTIIVSTVPILCVYPFLQKYFTKGAMIGAVKG